MANEKGSGGFCVDIFDCLIYDGGTLTKNAMSLIEKLQECTTCGKEYPLDFFVKDIRGKLGRGRKCRECRKDYQRKYRESNISKYKKLWDRKYSNKNERAYRTSTKGRLAHNAQERIRYHIKTGKIKKRNICEICYAIPTQCHHFDYSKPLEFIELCVKCHKYLHNNYHYDI